ncbi:MAG: hypothetical protein J0H42_15245 [Rhizobiales bacterium]|nr:hypothetical protein [Hyphomicrobiales bacterium]
MLDFDGPGDWVELERTSSHRNLSPKERGELLLVAVLLLAAICSDWL